MEYIDFDYLKSNQEAIRKDYQSKKPFRFVMFENFFKKDTVEKIYSSYPKIEEGIWNGTTYIDQKKKFQKTQFEDGSIFIKVFEELNSPDFLKWLEYISDIDDLEGDAELFGGGLHQSINGAFLNVHVDYNFHPTTKHHRRLNVLVYMNKDWHDEYEGHLELWDLANDKKTLLGKFSPEFNRCVIFETNEISFHGHPKALKTPDGVNRKSIATYYYTKTRPENEIGPEHNTIYINTEGVGGQLKRFNSGVKALLERINKK